MVGELVRGADSTGLSEPAALGVHLHAGSLEIIGLLTDGSLCVNTPVYKALLIAIELGWGDSSHTEQRSADVN